MPRWLIGAAVVVFVAVWLTCVTALILSTRY